ncbi:hypothetical protein DFH09DRAFT_1333489 [Mycena vulgaris]|nr:hypothetical protein DFH09DRAFT_1333489 [Mycena vulgaris]
MRRIFRARQVSIYPTLGLVYYLLASLHRAVAPTLSLGSHRRGTSSVLHERRSATCGWFPSYSGITRTDGAAEHRPSMSDTVFPSSTVLRHHHALHHRALGTRSRKIVPRTADFVAVAQFSHLLDVRLAILLLSAVGVAIAMVHRPASCSRNTCSTSRASSGSHSHTLRGSERLLQLHAPRYRTAERGSLVHRMTDATEPLVAGKWCWRSAQMDGGTEVRALWPPRPTWALVKPHALPTSSSSLPSPCICMDWRRFGVAALRRTLESIARDGQLYRRGCGLGRCGGLLHHFNTKVYLHLVLANSLTVPKTAVRPLGPRAKERPNSSSFLPAHGSPPVASRSRAQALVLRPPPVCTLKLDAARRYSVKKPRRRAHMQEDTCRDGHRWPQHPILLAPLCNSLPPIRPSSPLGVIAGGWDEILLGAGKRGRASVRRVLCVLGWDVIPSSSPAISVSCRPSSIPVVDFAYALQPPFPLAPHPPMTPSMDLGATLPAEGVGAIRKQDTTACGGYKRRKQM